MAPVVHPCCEIAEGCVIQDNVVIGLTPRGHRPGELVTRIGRGAVIRSGTVIYAGTVIGEHFQSGHGAMIREDNVIGDDCSVGTNTVLEPGNRIGNRTRIHSGCFLEYVTLGNGVFVGPSVTFTDDLYPPSPRFREGVLGAVVEDEVSIGGGATLLPGVHVGRRALIGAGSVVVKDVDPETVVVGNPARFLRKVDELVSRDGLYGRPYEWRE